MEHLRVSERPELRNPVLIAAFAGWNDAALCATAAVRYLVEQWHAKKFADIDPEEFFTFIRMRPTVRLDEQLNRHIDWPACEFYYHQAPELDHDFILFMGIEPSLKWRTFSQVFTSVARDFEARYAILVGALITETVHTVPVPVTGSSNDAELRTRLGSLIVRQSRYEGPTGIVGVITDRCAHEDVKTVSMWGAVPHYIANTPNPKVVASLVRHLRDILGFDLDIGELDAAARNFVSQVDEAVAGNEQLRGYIHERERSEAAGEESPGAPAVEEFPNSDTVIQSLEEFLRQNRLRPPSGD